MKQEKKFLGLTIILQTFGLGIIGIDRFYLCKTNEALGMLFASLVILGLPVTIVINLITALVCIYSTFTNKTCNLFMLRGVEFYDPNYIDKWLAFLCLLLILGIYIVLPILLIFFL